MNNLYLIQNAPSILVNTDKMLGANQPCLSETAILFYVSQVVPLSAPLGSKSQQEVDKIPTSIGTTNDRNAVIHLITGRQKAVGYMI